MSLFHISQETGKNQIFFAWYLRSILTAKTHLTVQHLVWLRITFRPLLMLYSCYLECLFLPSSTGSFSIHSPILDLNDFFPMRRFPNPQSQNPFFSSTFLLLFIINLHVCFSYQTVSLLRARTCLIHLCPMKHFYAIYSNIF